jgi:hypothetical protein
MSPSGSHQTVQQMILTRLESIDAQARQANEVAGKIAIELEAFRKTQVRIENVLMHGTEQEKSVLVRLDRIEQNAELSADDVGALSLETWEATVYRQDGGRKVSVFDDIHNLVSDRRRVKIILGGILSAGIAGGAGLKDLVVLLLRSFNLSP